MSSAGVVGHPLEPERLGRLAGDLQLGRQLGRLGHRGGLGVADADRHLVADPVDADLPRCTWNGNRPPSALFRPTRSISRAQKPSK